MLALRERLWNRLLAIAKRLGHVQAWLILTLFYFVILAPVALIYRLAADPLHVRRASGSIWQKRPAISNHLAWAKSQ